MTRPGKRSAAKAGIEPSEEVRTFCAGKVESCTTHMLPFFFLMKTMLVLAISPVVFHTPGFTFSFKIILCLLNYFQFAFFPKVVKIVIFGKRKKRLSRKRDGGHI